jgi:hypothetical protein
MPTMQKSVLDQLREGLPAFDREGTRIGTVVHVHREAPEGTLAPGSGYLEVDRELPERTVHLHVPLTSVVDAGPERVVLDPASG